MIKYLFFILSIMNITYAQGNIDHELKSFSDYLTTFNYSERKEMKINIAELMKLLKEDKAEIIDIRFREEVETWDINFVKSIPLNELPHRLDELNKEKIIVTTCPHYDRAALARHYLKLNGFNSKYLVEGLLGLADYLRGDNAKETISIINAKKGKLK